MQKISYNNHNKFTTSEQVFRYYSRKQSPQQLSLFRPKEDPPPYPLQITLILHEQRLKPDWCYKLTHYDSNLNLPGQFTIQEAQEILETTQYWNFSLDKNRIPRCAEELRSLINPVVAGGDR